MMYGQQGPWTQAYFLSRFGQQHTIPMFAMPHLAALRDEPAEYMAFLKTSRWSGQRYSKRARRLEYLHKLAVTLKANGIQSPVPVVTRPNGDQLVIHGNHRVATALVFNLDLPIDEWTPARWVKHAGFGHLSELLRERLKAGEDVTVIESQAIRACRYAAWWASPSKVTIG